MIDLIKFTESDFDRFISWIKSEEAMMQFAGPAFSWPVTKEQLFMYLNTPNRLIYKVVDNQSMDVIGHAELNNIDNKNKSARICRILVGELKDRNKGYGKAIIKELVRIGFEELKLHRLDLGVFNFNKQAIKCYRDCGFEIEGLMKENFKVKEEYWSTYNMSLLNKDL